jgi:prevent-host-death family protein
MTIHVNIGEAKTRLSQLVDAAVRGEDIVLAKAGTPQVRLVPVTEASEAEKERLRTKRRAAIGMFADAFKGYDTSLEALKAARGDPEEREQRKFGDIA